jgi:hypothetical protein
MAKMAPALESIGLGMITGSPALVVAFRKVCSRYSVTARRNDSHNEIIRSRHSSLIERTKRSA